MQSLVSPMPPKKEVIPAVENAWNRYLSDRSEDARNVLILHYMPLVRFAATRVAQRKPGQTEVDDLMQYGVFGLRDSIASFDPIRGVKFETYCALRIRGAMLDGLKSQNWVPRDVRQKLQQFNEADAQLATEFGGRPDDAAMMNRLGITQDDHAKLLRNSQACNISSLNTLCNDSSEREVQRIDLLRDHRECSPMDVAQRVDVRELFMKELSHNERHILTMYYYDEMTMREIGDVLGISGTRVSQIHSEVILRLRERLTRRLTQGYDTISSSIDM